MIWSSILAPGKHSQDYFFPVGLWEEILLPVGLRGKIIGDGTLFCRSQEANDITNHCRSGLLAMFAARAGAQHVFAIEGDPSLEQAARRFALSTDSEHCLSPEDCFDVHYQ